MKRIREPDGLCDAVGVLQNVVVGHLASVQIFSVACVNATLEGKASVLVEDGNVDC